MYMYIFYSCVMYIHPAFCVPHQGPDVRALETCIEGSGTINSDCTRHPLVSLHPSLRCRIVVTPDFEAAQHTVPDDASRISLPFRCHSSHRKHVSRTFQPQEGPLQDTGGTSTSTGTNFSTPATGFWTSLRTGPRKHLPPGPQHSSHYISETHSRTTL